jgi:hypothetical protein
MSSSGMGTYRYVTNMEELFKDFIRFAILALLSLIEI